MELASITLDDPFAGVELGYVDRGPRGAGRTVLCVHGLTRNARDFDVLARSLARRGARVIAVDVVGRGRSSWLPDPAGYALPTYAGHLIRFLERLEVREVDWIGTSMGGLIGMLLASGGGGPIRRLVLNDVGPFIPAAALQQIGTYLGLDRTFADLDALDSHLRLIHAGFGPLTDAQWRHLATHGARQTADGWRLAYDPAIRVPFLDAAAGDIDLWDIWDGIACPTLVLHGEDSALLLGHTAEEMRRRGPKAEIVHFGGVGHAPALMADDQVAAVETWLDLPTAR